MAVIYVPVASGLYAQGYKFIAATADTLPTAETYSLLSIGDRAKITDGQDKIWDGSSWITETGEPLGSVTISGTPAVTNTPSSSTPFSDTSVDNTDQTMKASAGVLTMFRVYNPNSSDAFLCFWNGAKSGAPTIPFRVPAMGYLDMSGIRISFSTSIHYNGATAIDGTGAPSTALELAASYE